jgi:hypothetical protein
MAGIADFPAATGRLTGKEGALPLLPSTCRGGAMKPWSSVATEGGAVLQVPNYLIYLQ